MIKRILFVGALCGLAFEVQAQWTRADSLNLQRMLGTNEEIRINKGAVRQIDFGSFVGSPEMIDDEPGLGWDSTLPKIQPEKKKIVLTLKPYTAKTPYNYDPVRQVKIKVTKDTWRSGTNHDIGKYSNASGAKERWVPTNWAKKPTDKGPRNSIEQIEATGLRYNPIGERANNMAVGGWSSGRSSGINDLDFNSVFTREFWDKSAGKRRKRTLEVLSSYGDSITIEINTPVQKITE